MFIFNINNVSITGNTGIKRLYIKNSDLDRFDIASEQVKSIKNNTITRLNKLLFIYFDRLNSLL